MEGFLLINKPTGIDSGSIVDNIKKIFKERKVGHTGTLDPLANGLLILCIGRKYTRQSEKILSLPKEYSVEIKLGITTMSFDRISPSISEFFFQPMHIETKDLLTKGKQIQKIPYLSAKKTGGKKLRTYAQKGIYIDTFHEVEIYNWKTTKLQLNKGIIALTLKVSKGTFIRSIVDELGKKLRYGATIQKLTRTEIGQFSLNNAITVEELMIRKQKNEPIPFITNLS